MCQFASLVLTKDKCFWSKVHDSHTEIVKEHGLSEDGARGPNVLKVEIVPPDGDFTRPMAEWAFRVDQDITPDWWEPVEGERRAREGLVDLHAYAVHMAGETNGISEGRHYVGGSATVSGVWGSATVRDVWGSATVLGVWGSATVRGVRGSATVRDVRGSATVTDMAGESIAVAYRKGAIKKMADQAVLVERIDGEPVRTWTAEQFNAAQAEGGTT